MRKKIALTISLLLLTLTGCESIDLTPQQEDLAAEYAANMILQHSYTYDKALISESSLGIVSETNGSDSSKTSKTNQVSSQEETPLNEAFGFESFSEIYKGYLVESSYPDAGAEDTLFVMSATEGTKLLVLTFDITNGSGQAIALDIPSKNYTYSVRLNEKDIYNAKLTVLMNALNTYSGTVEAGQTKELVLVFQVDDDYTAGINTVDLTVTRGDKQYITSLQ